MHLKRFTLSCVVAIGFLSCTPVDESSSQRSTDEVPYEHKEDVSVFNFTAGASDGRPEVSTTYHQNLTSSQKGINFKQLHPKTAEYYEVNPTDVVLRRSEEDTLLAFAFTNFQDALPLTEVVYAVKESLRLYNKEAGSNLSMEAYVDRWIANTGVTVFTPKNPVPSTDPDHYLKNALLAAVGITQLENPHEPDPVVRAQNPLIVASCAGCHSSAKTQVNFAEKKSFLIFDAVGDNAHGDPKTEHLLAGLAPSLA